MTQSKSITNNNERVSYKIDYFYDRFVKLKLRFPSLSKKKKDQVVTKRMYKEIISTYLNVYFYEIFWIDRPMYFMMGGKLMRCRVSQFTTKEGTLIKPSITVLWYLRPTGFMMSTCRINLMNGKLNQLPKMRREWMANNDLGLLPMIKTKSKELINNNLMFKT